MRSTLSAFSALGLAASSLASFLPYDFTSFTKEYAAKPNGTANPGFKSNPFTNLDDVKVSNYNSTSYDWWYFDAVSPTSGQYLTVIFWVHGSFDAFPAAGGATALPVHIQGRHANGTLFGHYPAAQGADVWSTKGLPGANGEWHDSGFAFYSDDIDTYRLVIDSDELGMRGDIKFSSTSQAHWPCRLMNQGSWDEKLNSAEIVPGVGWANAVPSAITESNLVMKNPDGSEVEFKWTGGIGYHDKNWGTSPFQNTHDVWYWGHATVGKYDIVWFDVALGDQEWVSSYVSVEGTVVAATCTPNSIKVRPFIDGTEADFPPQRHGPLPHEYRITIELPDSEHPLEITAPNDMLALEIEQFYARWISYNVTATMNGELVGTGRGLWEQFNNKSR